ncbi:MAG: 2-dehydropantoate 2-reductase [Bacteroidetes bacterium GWF2_42_66]|nr:MAG: 2-dehydropantoate 2-reductase [Bacteroidetes bacterium GWA2_42_15]OFX97041.1 MAG: 2-dehydropantoate 2-reductase [Bacteroidetes bacterium GWE2_42_39]OFY46155.1 MAG: 2-dehydropantoate 2-reductase [Bacteroidetes bacterium GWF2_42_66]HBL75664.1 2-dehydropantoate 2-reductase [Prolixibacteraceae bacterium]HCR91122.1 2-dehydropantoate 2-reductase [Prolixibacteraceae bacterium]
MKIAIIGTGGVGGYFGAKLAQAGNDVTFLARGEHLNAIRNNGLTVKSILGDFHVNNLNATATIHEIGQADLILLGVKAWQIKEIRNDLKSIIYSGSIVLPLQNGVLAVEELKESIDISNILGGLCRIISKIESPGVINHFGITPTIVFGEIDKSESERTQDLKAIFDQAGINSQVSKDIESDLWKKFISICVSGLLAVTKTTYGELRELNETRQMMIDLLNEGYALSQKIGVKIEPDYVDKSVSFIDSFPSNSTSSLTRDVWECRPSEIDYQNGTIVRLGEKYGVATPVNKFVYSCILPMELKARKLRN